MCVCVCVVIGLNLAGWGGGGGGTSYYFSKAFKEFVLEFAFSVSNIWLYNYNSLGTRKAYININHWNETFMR